MQFVEVAFLLFMFFCQLSGYGNECAFFLVLILVTQFNKTVVYFCCKDLFDLKLFLWLSSGNFIDYWNKSFSLKNQQIIC